jgi:hypothetical protein
MDDEFRRVVDALLGLLPFWHQASRLKWNRACDSFDKPSRHSKACSDAARVMRNP